LLAKTVHRQNLLKLLENYRTRNPDESVVVNRFVSFVSANPRCFERDCWVGHVTGSVWLVNSTGSQVLLTHHKKLGRWLQLGGHSDGDADTARVALREAQEESGLDVSLGFVQGKQQMCTDIFDIDVHEIPARKDDPAHYHFDVRFVVQCLSHENYLVSDESHDLAWVNIAEIESFTLESSILRMKQKWQDL